MIEKGRNMNEIRMNVKYKPWSYAVRMTKAYVESKIEKIKNVYPFQDGIPTFRHIDLTSAFGQKITTDIFDYGRHYHEDKMPGGHVDNYISSQIVYEYFANITASDSPVFWMPVTYGETVNIHYGPDPDLINEHKSLDGYFKKHTIELPFESKGKERVMPKGYIVWCTKEEEAWAKNKLESDSELKHNIENLESHFTEFLKIEDKKIEAEDRDLYDD